MNPQLLQLMIAYGVTSAAMFAGMRLMRCDRRGYFRWPLYSAIAVFLGVYSWNLLREHVLPPMWTLMHARAMYFAALALYAVFGFGLGLLVGRATRSPPPVGRDVERL